ncbi:MAG TPA: hypothetical protein VNM47_17375 [Terriglobia bacterium]|nr:hypothetical protein [Terriglobia bacterium]
MKTIRSLMTLAGLSVVLFALGATGAKAQALANPDFAGTFTLSNNAQWGNVALPAGNYTLRYGSLYGSRFVEVRGTEKGSPHGVIRVEGSGQSSASKSVLVCAREGDTLIVRALDMAGVNKSVNFVTPHGTKLVANNGKHNGYTQLAEAPMLIQRIPVTLNAK